MNPVPVSAATRNSALASRRARHTLALFPL